MRENIAQKTWVKLAFISVIVGAVVLWQTAYWSRQITLDQIGERSEHTLNLIVQALRGDLSKIRYLPQVLGANEDFKAALRGHASETSLRSINEELERINGIAGALDTYLMNAQGLTVAASNWASDTTFIGKNFSYRPYFRAAMEGRLGRYFAIGTTSGERGYYFSYPVRDHGDVIGAVVVKIQVKHHENSWKAQDHEVIAVDQNGVVFLSSEPDWRFHTLSPLADNVAAQLKTSKRYRNETLMPLVFTPKDAAIVDGSLVTITTNKTSGRSQEKFLIQEQVMADADLRIILLARTGQITSNVRFAMAMATALLACIFLAAFAVYQRRRRLADRIAVQEESNAQLEQRVLERTNALTNVNAELQNEVCERKRAEEEVRKTQVTLLQTAKLAALGQMSAGLSHELNQPLAAIRSYADNAREFIDRKRTDTAKKNLKGIAELTERMARIIRNLRTYAREETIELRPTPLGAVLAESLILMDQRIRSEGVTIRKNLPDAEISVIAGDVRLQQVFVNLISNALDAMHDSPVREIHIIVTLEGEDVVIVVRDTGSGIEEDQIINVFDPFYSSKEVGQGMGLGLSITFGLIDQFGGTIEARNAADGGATFTLRLKRANVTREAIA